MSDVADNAASTVEGATDEVAQHIEQGTDSLHQGYGHLEEAVQKIAVATEANAQHIGKIAEYLVQLHPVEAAQEIPDAASETVQDAANVGGETLEGAADVVATPAVVVERKRKKVLGRRK